MSTIHPLSPHLSLHDNAAPVADGPRRIEPQSSREGNDDDCCCTPLLQCIQRVWFAVLESIKAFFSCLFPCCCRPSDEVDRPARPALEDRVNSHPPLPRREGDDRLADIVLPSRTAESASTPRAPAPASEPNAAAPEKPIPSLVQSKSPTALTLPAIAQEVHAYAHAWDALRGSYSNTLSLQPEATIDGSLQKYLAFLELGLFEYSLYPEQYRGYYFAVIRRDARLLTMELLKLEQEALALNDRDERAGVLLRMREALHQIGYAASTGCDPQKATVTFQQLKQVSVRIDVFETIMQYLQDAKLAIFTKRVKGVETVGLPGGGTAERVRNSIDESLWSAHCYNWIYANFGKDFGLCSNERLVTATRDQYRLDEHVTGLTQELTHLEISGEMRQVFRREFSKDYLENAILDAINMDEYQKPYMEALQVHCKELQEDPKLWEKYMKTMLSPRGTSYIFTKEAVAFFLRQTNEAGQTLQTNWDNDREFWMFIQNSIPAAYDGVTQEELNAVNPAHLLRLWRTYFEQK